MSRLAGNRTLMMAVVSAVFGLGCELARPDGLSEELLHLLLGLPLIVAGRNIGTELAALRRPPLSPP